MAHFATPQGPVTPDSRRRWVRRTVIAINIFLATALVAGIALVGYGLFVYHKYDRLSLGLGGSNVHDPINVLIVGSDSRADIPKSQQKSFGNVGGQRSDTIMLAHLDPDKKAISIISFPRDLWVPIGSGTNKAKINSAYESGKNSTDGGKQLIQTIQRNFNVHIDHYVEVDFAGFQSIVDTIGGVNVYFDTPVRDNHSGLHLDTAGCIKLHGPAALAYARSRYYEEKINGVWREDPRSDLGRIDRQQDFLKRVASRAISQAGKSDLTAEALVRHSASYVKIDDAFGITDLIQLAQEYRKVDPQKIQALGAIPATGGRSADGQSILNPNFEQANIMLAPFRNETTATTSGSTTATSGGNTIDTQVPSATPSSVSVRVLNGSGVSKQAATVEQQLKSQGFTTVGNSAADNFAYTKTVIRYAVGHEADARLVQTYVKGDSILLQSTVNGADVELVTGASFTGISASTTSTSLKSFNTTSSTIQSTTSTSAGSGVTTPTTRAPIGAPSQTQCTQQF